MFATKKTKTYATYAALYLTVTVGIFGGFIYVVRLQGAELMMHASVIKTQRDQEQVYFELRQELAQTENQRETIKKYFLPFNDDLQFLTGVENLMRNAGLAFRSSSLGDRTTTEEGRIVLGYDFQFSGNPETVDAMVRYFETLPYKSEVKRLEKDMRDDNTVSGSISIQVTTDSYD